MYSGNFAKIHVRVYTRLLDTQEYLLKSSPMDFLKDLLYLLIPFDTFEYLWTPFDTF